MLKILENERLRKENNNLKEENKKLKRYIERYGIKAIIESNEKINVKPTIKVNEVL